MIKDQRGELRPHGSGSPGPGVALGTRLDGPFDGRELVSSRSRTPARTAGCRRRSSRGRCGCSTSGRRWCLIPQGGLLLIGSGSGRQRPRPTTAEADDHGRTPCRASRTTTISMLCRWLPRQAPGPRGWCRSQRPPWPPPRRPAPSRTTCGGCAPTAANSAGKTLRVLRGEFHRHTELLQRRRRRRLAGGHVALRLGRGRHGLAGQRRSRCRRERDIPGG